jgi:hypothetical protein
VNAIEQDCKANGYKERLIPVLLDLEQSRGVPDRIEQGEHENPADQPHLAT